MSAELLPCPFCGGEASIAINDGIFSGRLYTPKCACGANLLGVWRTEAEAVAAWNTRAERTCRLNTAFIGYIPAWYECGECKQPMFSKYRYCPNCGAKVVEE